MSDDRLFSADIRWTKVSVFSRRSRGDCCVHFVTRKEGSTQKIRLGWTMEYSKVRTGPTAATQYRGNWDSLALYRPTVSYTNECSYVAVPAQLQFSARNLCLEFYCASRLENGR